MSNDQSKKQTQTNKAGTYTQTGFTPKPAPAKKSITLLDIILGKK